MPNGIKQKLIEYPTYIDDIMVGIRERTGKSVNEQIVETLVEKFQTPPIETVLKKKGK